MEEQSTPWGQRPRPIIIEATDGAWTEAVPPDLQPHFRCLVHPPGSTLLPDRWAALAAPPPPALPSSATGAPDQGPTEQRATLPPKGD